MNTRLFPYQIALISEVNIIEEEGLVEQAEQRGNYLLASLRKIQNLHEQIGDVRGKGLLV